MHSCVGLRYSPRALLDECGMAQSQGPQLDVKMALADLCEARPASFVALLSVRASVCALAGLEEKTTTPTVYTACAEGPPMGPSSGPPSTPIVGAQLTAAVRIGTRCDDVIERLLVELGVR